MKLVLIAAAIALTATTALAVPPGGYAPSDRGNHAADPHGPASNDNAADHSAAGRAG